MSEQHEYVDRAVNNPGPRRSKHRARRDFRVALETLSDNARQLARRRLRGTDPCTALREACALRVDAIDSVTYAVIASRVLGASWQDVADTLRLSVEFVRDHYEPIMAQWADGGGVGPVVAVAADDGHSLRLVSEHPS